MHSLRTFAIAAAALLALLAPATLRADSTTMVSGLDILRTWNLVVLGDLDSTSEVEGKTWVGGDLTGSSSNYAISSEVDTSDGVPGLIVVGDVTGSTKNLENGSGAIVGGDVDSGFNLNGDSQTVLVGGSLSNTNINSNTVDSGLSTSDPAFTQNLTQQASLIETSTQDLTYTLSQEEATSTVTISGTTATFTAVVNSDGVAVFNIDASTLEGITEISFDTNGADTVIVNVSGTSITLDQNFLGDASGLGESVIWNFYEAQTLTLSSAWYGSILAPYAAATTYNFIEGSAVFASLEQYGEIHEGTYSGSWEPSGSDDSDPGTSSSSSGGTSVPEPGMLLLFALGLCALILRQQRPWPHTQDQKRYQ